MSIIGISGKKQSGKNTVAKIIQLLCDDYVTDGEIEDYITQNKPYHNSQNWQIIAFADKLKDIVCLLTGCTREQLEDEKFKNTKLPNEWIRYSYADGFTKDDKGNTTMLSKQCSKERYEEELRVNWQTAYKYHPTYRDLLQHIGTDLFRNQLHSNIWINSTFVNYKPINFLTYKNKYGEEEVVDEGDYPKWIIADMRFPNELEAVKKRGGITIRVERDTENQSNHKSETALDTVTFDYIINNNATIDELISQVKQILIKEQII